MRPYHKYTDYIGVDLYFGTFENVVKSMETYPAVMKMLHAVTGKPIILAEFGYIGCGEPKTPEEKAEILEKYGVHSEEEAKQTLTLATMKNVHCFSRVNLPIIFTVNSPRTLCSPDIRTRPKVRRSFMRT